MELLKQTVTAKSKINNGEWIKSIESIKDKYPKPENSEP